MEMILRSSDLSSILTLSPPLCLYMFICAMKFLCTYTSFFYVQILPKSSSRKHKYSEKNFEVNLVNECKLNDVASIND